ncbi:hypothetical protein FRB96_000581 [Tulasnella sp. 330]|nr:hypothetical protein FRB96_000581 [Tulasnella sp. 330]KAG8882071.1 hypothetical protein FRB97_008741 [Tulasnella sp. 331]
MTDSEKRSISSCDEKLDGGGPILSILTSTSFALTSPDERSVFISARRKIDLVVVPLTTLLCRLIVNYALLTVFLSYLDRSNIGNAKVAGFQKDVGLTNWQYSVGLTVFYVGYIVIDIPSNLFTKKLGSNRHLPFCVFIWGIITICQGSVKNFGGYVTIRFMLGLAEGGLTPGLLIYIAGLYRRQDLQLRISLLYCATAMAGGFSGLLAAGIQQLDGVLGHKGWAWIFYLEGAATSILAILIYFFMPASAKDIKWLTPAEQSTYAKALQESWMEEEVGPLNLREAMSIVKDPQTLFLTVISFAIGCTLAGLAFFAAPVLKDLGYSSTKTQLLSVPPFAAAAVVSVFVAYLSDKYQQRSYACAFSSTIAAVGYAMFLASDNKHILYASVFLQVIGVYGTSPAVVAWITNNTWPHYKRATMVGFGIGINGTGSILSTWLFNDAPRYRKGTIINLSLSVTLTAVALATRAYYDGQNRKKVAIRASGQFDDSEESRKILGDAHPSFTYTL